MRALLACAAIFVASTGALPAQAAAPNPAVQVYLPVAQGVSPPLRDLAPVHDTTIQIDRPRHPKYVRPTVRRDPVIQGAPSPNAPATPGTSRSFDGVGQGIPGYFVSASPPDTNGAVGATQYVQWVNASYAVFDKSTGQILLGPTLGSSIWASLGASPCATRNDGDPIAQYDKGNNRWVMTQFAVPNQNSGPNFQCVAVSTSPDATGSYNLYVY
ncbi:MAG TPA: hypothetical protein VGR61_10930, partial [Candidatus Dormibacteraeota bacterium]|nr:hypothetical protein [Candidatus Dormibacteraeota bacterium]